MCYSEFHAFLQSSGNCYYKFSSVCWRYPLTVCWRVRSFVAHALKSSRVEFLIFLIYFLFALNTLAKKFGKENIGLYRDDGLALIQSNFLDVTFNLKDGSYSPYRKPDNNPLYIDKRSNHPPSITKHLPASIN
jgi:hypothetical protein